MLFPIVAVASIMLTAYFTHVLRRKLKDALDLEESRYQTEAARTELEAAHDKSQVALTHLRAALRNWATARRYRTRRRRDFYSSGTEPIGIGRPILHRPDRQNFVGGAFLLARRAQALGKTVGIPRQLWLTSRSLYGRVATDHPPTETNVRLEMDRRQPQRCRLPR